MRKPASNYQKAAIASALAISIAVGFVPVGVAFGDTSTTTTSTSISSTTSTTTTTTSTIPSTTTTTTPKRPPRVPLMRLGSHGLVVAKLQRQLAALGYWVGVPDGVFGDSTQQAVYALQKAANLRRDGQVGATTEAALFRKVRPKVKSKSGYVVEVNLHTDLVMLVLNGKLLTTLNTSTGGGYTYTSQGVTSVAITPSGRFHIEREINKPVNAPLGQLWRPKYFTGGFAIHGDSYVPPTPVSHGCVRVSNEAMNWIWSAGKIPLGTAVWVY